MSDASVLTFERAVRDMTLHGMEHRFVERLQGLGECAGGLCKESVNTIGQHKVHEVEYGRLSVLVVVRALRVCALFFDCNLFFHNLLIFEDREQIRKVNPLKPYQTVIIIVSFVLFPIFVFTLLLFHYL